jgi:hypothetical protein
MKAHQEIWVEALREYTNPWNKTNMENNVLGICCQIIGDDTGDTDALAQVIAEILKRVLAEHTVSPNVLLCRAGPGHTRKHGALSPASARAAG